MRGGIRQGAGRKPSESTVRVSVPVGVLDEVNKLIADYKNGVLNDCHIIKDDILIECQEIKQADSLIDNQEIKDAVKGLQGLNTRTCKVLRKGFGSLYKAAESGVRAEYGGGLWVPNEFRHLMGDLE